MLSVKLSILFVFAAVIISQDSNALKILGIFPLAGKSHFVMGEELLKILAQKGHKVDVVSHFPQKKPFPNYTDISLAGLVPMSVNNVSISDTENFNGLSLGYFVKHAGVVPCELMNSPPMQQLLSKPKNSYDVVIVELFVAQCYIGIGSYFNAPTVGVVTSKIHDWLYAPFGNPFNTAYMASLFSSSTQEMTFLERIKNTLLSQMIILQFNYHVEDERESVEKYLGRKISSIRELYDDVALMLVNSHYSLNEIKPTTPDIIDVGGLHVGGTGQELSADHKKWLDESKEGCVYISFGSMVRIETLAADKLEAFYEMFRRIAPVRVLMKIADPKLLPPNLPENVKTSSWLPQVAVLIYEPKVSNGKHTNQGSPYIRTIVEYNFLQVPWSDGLISRIVYGGKQAGVFLSQLGGNEKITVYLREKHGNVKAFVTHGGLMGTQESIAWGVPLVGLALFGDQHTNINSYARKKIAVALDIKTFDADTLTNAVNTVLKDPEYRKNTKKVAELFMDRPMSAKDTAIYWVEYAARNGKRLKSPATKLTWWQYHLLDVYGLLLGGVFLILYITKKILSFIFGLCFSRKKMNKASSKFSETKKRK